MSTATIARVVPFPIHRTDTQEMRKLDSLRTAARPLLRWLQEPHVEDVVVNEDGILWIKKQGNGFERAAECSSRIILNVLSQVATHQGLAFSERHPVLETIFPLDGSRLTGLRSPIVQGAALALRTHPRRIFTLDDYEAANIITDCTDERNKITRQDHFLEEIGGKTHGQIIRIAIAHRKNIVLVGSTGSGKTTALNMLTNEIAQQFPQERVVSIEDTRELQLGSIPNHVSLLAAAGISFAACLKVSLRMNPDRILVGEVRSSVARTLLHAWNTGHRGGLATIHADNAESGLQRIEEMLGGRPRDHRPMIARAIDLVLFMDEDHGIPAGRKLREVLVVKGYDRSSDSYVVQRV